MRFVNGEDAGRRLGYNLALRPLDQPIVIGLPRAASPSRPRLPRSSRHLSTC